MQNKNNIVFLMYDDINMFKMTKEDQILIVQHNRCKLD